MTVVIGLPRDERAPAALQLGVVLARSLGTDAVVATVVPEPWPPGFGRVDGEFHQLLDQDAQDALQRARALLPADVPAEFVTTRARSTPSGLLAVAAQHDAALIALGSTSAGVLGRVAFGSVAERLLHSSPLPIALAPRGYRARPDTRITEVTAAFAATPEADELGIAVAGVAAAAGAALRIASFAVRPRTPLTAGIGSRAEGSVLHAWIADVERAQQRVLAEIGRLPHPPAPVSAVVGHGTDWAQALEDLHWGEGSVLAVGSSAAGPLERVFLGSRSSKIVRLSPVPVVVLPRGAARELAHRAETG